MVKGDEKKDAEAENKAARLWINGIEAFKRKLGLAEGSGTLVADHAAGEAGQDWSQGGQAWPLCHLPIGRGCCVENLVPENPGLN